MWPRSFAALAFVTGCNTAPTQAEAQAAIEETLHRDHAPASAKMVIENVRIVEHAKPVGSPKRRVWKETVDYDVVLTEDVPGLDNPVSAPTIRATVVPLYDGCEKKGCRRTRHTSFELDRRSGRWVASEQSPRSVF